MGFASRIVQESLELGTRVQWYTTLLGHLSSVSAVIEELGKAGVKNWAVTEFVQGHRTRRWGVGWSWLGWRPTLGVARGTGAVGKHLLPFPGEFVVQLKGVDEKEVARSLNGVMAALPLQWKWKPEIGTGVGFSGGDVWSRKARRKVARKSEMGSKDGNKEEGREDGEDENDDEKDDMSFGFKITVKEATKQDEWKGAQVVVRWLKGFDSAQFESFCGMVKRKLEGS